MTKYIAVTESGADYHIDTDSGFWSHRDLNTDRIWSFQTAENPTALPWTEEGKLQWQDAVAPEVGKNIYLASRDYWRISTPVVSVEIEDD